MAILKTIDQEIKQAMQKGNAKVVATLRLLKNALKNKEIELRAKKKELTEEDEIEVFAKEAKKRKESIEAFDKGGRGDLSLGEKEELEIISRYLPEQLSEDKIKEIIQKTKKSLGSLTIKDFGRLMSAVMKETKGKADGNMVNRLVKEVLK